MSIKQSKKTKQLLSEFAQHQNLVNVNVGNFLRNIAFTINFLLQKGIINEEEYKAFLANAEKDYQRKVDLQSQKATIQPSSGISQ